MKIKTIKKGPLSVTGLKLKDSKGNIISEDKEYLLCRCGHSKNKPFCDGTHSKINWDDSKKELENFARINGVNDVHKLSIEDIMTTSNEISENTDIKHV